MFQYLFLSDKLLINILLKPTRILGEQAIEDAKYEEYEKYMLAQEAAGIKEDPIMADASCLF